MKAGTTSSQGWLQLLRPPNLFTVPGDVLVGVWLATPIGFTPSWFAIPTTALAVMCLYLAGLIMNDMADLEEDRRDRPDRPLPSGTVSFHAAGLAMLGLVIVALILLALVKRRAMIFGFALLAVIALYNRWAKNKPAFGPITMGVCRGFSLLVGAAAVAPKNHPELYPGLMAGFEILVLYIAGITLLARQETLKNNPSLQAGFPLLMLLIGLLAFPVFVSLHSPAGKIIFATLGVVSLIIPFHVARTIWSRGHVRPPDIGKLIGNLIPLQAALLAWCAPLPWAFALLLLYPVSRFFSRWFYAS